MSPFTTIAPDLRSTIFPFTYGAISFALTIDYRQKLHPWIQYYSFRTHVVKCNSRSLTRAALGGYFEPPSRFLAISSKPMQVSPPNLQYPLFQQCYTLCYNFKVQGIIVRPQMTSESRHVPPISTENKGLWNRLHECSFKATINCFIRNDGELVGLQNCYLGFSKF